MKNHIRLSRGEQRRSFGCASAYSSSLVGASIDLAKPTASRITWPDSAPARIG